MKSTKASKNINQAENSEKPFDFNRRSFISKAAWATAGLTWGLSLLSGKNTFAALKSAPANSLSDKTPVPAGKHPDLVILSDKPLNAETPAHLLDDVITPADKLFVRNNGLVPEKIDTKSWTLTIDGESVNKKTVFTLDDLKKKFKHYTYQLVHECAGNGRSEFSPAGRGNQWTTGGVGCCEWTGVRLRDVLEAAGIKKDAVYIGYYGKDTHLSGKPGEVPISRGVPMRKALEDEALIAWAMNGKDIPVLHGYPLRLMFGGWPASTCGKWLSRISVRNKVHDGPKMNGHDYRLPKQPIAPGAKIPEDNEHFRIIEAMPVKSVITYPKTGAQITAGKPLEVRGHAWVGDLNVKEMHVSIDYGATWQKCTLKDPRNRNCWQQWSAQINFPDKGYYEVWARATDSNNRMQPMLVPAWNPGGYLNNACHRIAVEIV